MLVKDCPLPCREFHEGQGRGRPSLLCLADLLAMCVCVRVCVRACVCVCARVRTQASVEWPFGATEREPTARDTD